jgi:hypothetical protein
MRIIAALAAMLAIATGPVERSFCHEDHCPQSVLTAWAHYQETHPETLGRGPGADRCMGA